MTIETEAKFLVSSLRELERRLSDLNALPVQPRSRELNLRFDRPDDALTRAGHVLRLRQDTRVRLTYKDAGTTQSSIRSRREIEVEVEDFETTRDLLLSLGYQIVFIYEKYRSTYALDTVECMLDELPYGDFVEIEGPAETIPSVVHRLGLDWSAAITMSYHELFQHLRQTRSLPITNLTFEDFVGISVAPADLGVRAAA